MTYEKDEATHIRFGGFGAGSETWIKGAKLKPAQVKALQRLLDTTFFVEDVKPEKEENLENMLE
jgi:hypothetical protein